MLPHKDTGRQRGYQIIVDTNITIFYYAIRST